MHHQRLKHCLLLLLTLLNNSTNNAFTIPHSQFATKSIIVARQNNIKYNNAFFLQMSSNNDDDDVKQGDSKIASDKQEVGMSFDEATAALKEQEDKERAAARGAMFEEVSIPFFELHETG